MSFLLIYFFKPRFYFFSTACSDTSMALPQSAVASRFTSLRQQRKPNRMKGQVITAARRGAAWCQSLVPGVLRSAPRAQKQVEVTKYASASVAGPLMEGCFGCLKEPRSFRGRMDGGEGNACVKSTGGMKRVTKTLLCPCGKQPLCCFFCFFFKKGWTFKNTCCDWLKLLGQNQSMLLQRQC